MPGKTKRQKMGISTEGILFMIFAYGNIFMLLAVCLFKLLQKKSRIEKERAA